MKYYVKHYPDGDFEFSPVGRKGAPREGFEIVNKLPQEIIDKLPGGKDHVQPTDRLAALEARIAELEAKGKP